MVRSSPRRKSRKLDKSRHKSRRKSSKMYRSRRKSRRKSMSKSRRKSRSKSRHKSSKMYNCIPPKIREWFNNRNIYHNLPPDILDKIIGKYISDSIETLQTEQTKKREEWRTLWDNNLYNPRGDGEYEKLEQEIVTSLEDIDQQLEELRKLKKQTDRTCGF